MESKLVVVTSPTYYHASQLSIMLYDVVVSDTNIITEALLDSNLPIALHLAYTKRSERQWILNTARQVDHVVINLKKPDLIKGFILNSPHVMYYNSNTDIKQLNMNDVPDPVDYILRVIHDNRQKPEL